MHVGDYAGMLMLIACLGEQGLATTAGGSKLLVPPKARLEQLCSEQCLPVQRMTGRWMVFARMKKSVLRTKGQR